MQQKKHQVLQKVASLKEVLISENSLRNQVNERMRTPYKRPMKNDCTYIYFSFIELNRHLYTNYDSGISFYIKINDVNVH